jgi:hypothetical protein
MQRAPFTAGIFPAPEMAACSQIISRQQLIVRGRTSQVDSEIERKYFTL